MHPSLHPLVLPSTMLRVAPLLILLTGAPEATAKEPRRNPLGVRDSRRQLSTASDKLVVDADGLVDRVSEKAIVKPSKGASHGDKKLLFSSIVIPPSPPEYECDAGACPSPPITSLHARFSAQLLCAHSSAHTPLRTRCTPAHWRAARASLRTALRCFASHSAGLCLSTRRCGLVPLLHCLADDPSPFLPSVGKFMCEDPKYSIECVNFHPDFPPKEIIDQDYERGQGFAKVRPLRPPSAAFPPSSLRPHIAPIPPSPGSGPVPGDWRVVHRRVRLGALPAHGADGSGEDAVPDDRRRWMADGDVVRSRMPPTTWPRSRRAR